MKMNRSMAEAIYWKQMSLRGRGAVRDRLEWLVSNETKSPVEIDEIQAAKLRDLVAHSYRTVPYYRELMDERGLKPDDIATPADLAKLPVLSRARLAAHQDRLLSSEADTESLQVNFSSGSTGVRAQFSQDQDFRLWMRAHQLRTYAWCSGWKLGDPFVLLWGSEIYWSLKQRIEQWENRLVNRREFNTFRLSPELIAAFLDELIAFRPALVSTYSNAIHLITGEAARRGLRIEGLRAVQATSEPLPPALRERIEQTLNCEVYDKYGMRESNVVAHESPDHNGMLLQSENVVVEILDDDLQPCPEGVRGKLVVTPLNNRAMPLLRYETSDVAALLPRAADAILPFPRISSVAGRLQDLIVVPGQGHVDSYFFSYLLMQQPLIHWFQVIQDRPEALTIRVYAPDGLDRATRNQLVERIVHHTQFPFQVEFDVLHRMPESSTGKFRLCVSNLEQTPRLDRA
ncbi:phenylacetate--CoA ligase family protein [Jatrophihabitans lederbergiae]|uniref:AMP-binding protein n=1 Tax=Jatrophihabitans lederbergiae TaxID=3075547 RepID=A0ABU2JBX0_9ACTN|nr:AMP-binding protein [Jatrophihabitans sp. DSM 44399]MDT0262447.1 AMP-binding protein [Jatrophihabitans sp. DSM 44399]